MTRSHSYKDLGDKGFAEKEFMPRKALGMLKITEDQGGRNTSDKDNEIRCNKKSRQSSHHEV